MSEEGLRRRIKQMAEKIAVDPYHYARDDIINDLYNLSMPPKPGPWWICLLPIAAGFCAGVLLHAVANVSQYYGIMSGMIMGGFLSFAFFMLWIGMRWEYRKALRERDRLTYYRASLPPSSAESGDQSDSSGRARSD